MIDFYEMVVKVTETAPSQWSNPNLPRSPSLAGAASSLSLPKRCRSNAGLVLKSAFFGSHPTIIRRSRSCCEFLNPKWKSLTRSCIDESDEEVWKKYKKFEVRCSWLKRGESAYCSMKKAFASMVFIIRELHSYNLQMREFLFYEDLQGILVRVEKEMHASFVWLFQQVFSHTPTLMIYVMLLLANYSVYSMGNTLNPPTPTLLEVQVQDLNQNQILTIPMFDSSMSGGNKGGGRKVRPATSGTDGDEWLHKSKAEASAKIEPQGGRTDGDEWLDQSKAEASAKIEPQGGRTDGDEWLDQSKAEASAKIEPQGGRTDGDEWVDKSKAEESANIGGLEHHFRMELVYRTILSQDPDSPLLLANYAQFLYTIVHNYDRAEEMFKKAIQVKPTDGEAYSKYANFLWKAKNDLWGAEESLLGAIEADTSNSYYTANYADFLWNSGGDDTCFPI